MTSDIRQNLEKDPWGAKKESSYLNVLDSANESHYTKTAKMSPKVGTSPRASKKKSALKNAYHADVNDTAERGSKRSPRSPYALRK